MKNFEVKRVKFWNLWIKLKHNSNNLNGTIETFWSIEILIWNQTQDLKTKLMKIN